jgi:pimeloyl-ACP methyl ester carboxylesterase
MGQGGIIAGEIAAFGAAVALRPLRRLAFARGRRTPRRREQRTLVFVHGYLANGACFLALRGYLRLRGYRGALSYEYAPGDSVERAARGLKAFLKAHVRGGRIDLVCHSLGGLVALSYLAELGGARRVDRCITLGTPFRGTYNAYWVPGRMGYDLRPGSPLIRRLARARRGVEGVAMTTIAAAADNIVLPRASAGVVEGVGHAGMLFSPTVFRRVAAALER